MAKTSNRIGGWLIAIIAIMVLSLLSALALTAQRISFILAHNASSGVYISLIFLVPYVALLAYTIYLTFRKKQDAVTMFISSAIIGSLFAIWFYLIGPIIYALELFKLVWKLDVLMAVFNLAILAVVTAYFLKSKRVKNTLTKK